MASKFKSKIKLMHCDRIAKLSELEQVHFQKNGKLPAKTRGSHYYNILKERDIATGLLRSI